MSNASQTTSSRQSGKNKTLTIIYLGGAILSLALCLFGYFPYSQDRALARELAERGQVRDGVVYGLAIDSSSTTRLKKKYSSKRKGVTLTDHLVEFRFKRDQEAGFTDRFHAALENGAAPERKANPQFEGTDYVSAAYYKTLKSGSRIKVSYLPGHPERVKILNPKGEPYFLPYAKILFWFFLFSTLFFVFQLVLYRKTGKNL
ncbi:DUF3592 domain-containing protein [Roseibacillus persicicus]|uniref:hypothetical protein n=1 Tax=Roseibacillus persicicus TaxID=454148 RepID=UPI00398AF4C3